MKQRTVTPVDGSVYAERELAGARTIENALEAAVRAQVGWRRVPLAERATIADDFVRESRRAAMKDDDLVALPLQRARHVRADEPAAPD